MSIKVVFFTTIGFTVIAGIVMATDTGTLIKKTGTDTQLHVKENSPNWRDGKFVNSIPVHEPKFFASLVKWIRGADNTSPNSPVPVVERTASDFDIPPKGGLRITWLGHSTLLVEIDGYRVLIDPVWSSRPSPLSWMGPRRFHKTPLPINELPAINAVLISHDHYDHLDKYTVKKLGERVPMYIVPLGIGKHLKHWGVSPDRIKELDWWGGITLDDLSFTATPARHFSGRSLVMADKNETLWSGWVIASSKHRIFYSGDTGMFPGFNTIGERLGPFDVVLIEIGAYDQLWADLHIGPEQAIEARLALGSGLFVPVHWGTFDLAMHAWTEPIERLLVAANSAGVQVAAPIPGGSIEPAKPQQVKQWWPDVPWHTAAETPIVSSGLNTFFHRKAPTEMTTNAQP